MGKRLQAGERVNRATGERGLPDTIDREWLDDFRAATSDHGTRKELAKAIGASASAISHLRAGERAPWWIVLRASDYLGLPLPSHWLHNDEYRLIRAMRQARRKLPAAQYTAVVEQALRFIVM